MSFFRECKYPNGTSYHKSTCKSCESRIQINRIKKNGLTSTQKLKMSLYKKEYTKKNRVKLNEQYRNRLHSDVSFRLRKNISRQVCRILNDNGSCKFGKSVLKFLGYSILQLKKHLENQFDSSMSWENYGIYWHIDHIVPQSCLPYTSMEDNNFKKCWTLSNLRPLEAKMNMLDGSTRIRHKMYTNTFNGEV
jgi:hypothetical protein